MIEGRTRQTLAAAGMGLLLVSHLFAFTPVALYAGNSREFTVSLWTLLVQFVRPAVFAVALVALIGTLVPPRAFRRFLAVLAAASLMLWLQGNVIVWDYGLLDGTAIDWNAGRWRGWLDLCAWALALIGAALASRRAGQILVRGAIGVFAAMLAMSAATVVLHANDIGGKQTDRNAAALGEMYRFSPTRNVLHIVADGLQSDVLAAILADGEPGRRLASALDGFVLFDRHMGAFPYTHMSVPAILGGKLYRNEVPREKFLDDAVGPGSPTILNAAAAAGFEVDLAVTAGLEHLYARGAATHVYPLTSSLHVSEAEFARHDAATLFDLSLFRVVPHFLKERVYRDQRWLAQDLLSSAGSIGMRSFAHTEFLRQMHRNMRTDRDAPVYKLLHVMTSHNPMATNERCEYAGMVLPTVRETVTTQARCGLMEVAALLERMKELGIYDSSTIVLMADHGAWIPPAGIKPLPGDNGKTWNVHPVAMAMAVPAFAVKPPGAHGPLQVSAAPSWIVDTAPTIAAAAGIPGNFAGRNALELSTDETRERRFYLYEYQRSEWDSDYLTPIQEFTVNGTVTDQASWQAQATHLPGGEIR